ncbi:hypothetical protein Q6348_08430 [Isoptericola sp. b441]|uniref:DNA-binding protein n=1 Tax=Actinotalea lenta TaxID=3064654 RepID=A0ABT9D8J7_9CELL|nr:hypothetical protein [Isoptericola sp. b441]MDO8107219.1 hypothetical protein [Isoptericola sp. b441]
MAPGPDPDAHRRPPDDAVAFWRAVREDHAALSDQERAAAVHDPLVGEDLDVDDVPPYAEGGDGQPPAAGVAAVVPGDLSADQIEALRRVGIEPYRPSTGAAESATSQRYADLVAQSLSVTEAARLLDVDEGQVRAMLAGRALYGFTDPAGAYRLPPWQFRDSHVVPGLAEVLAAFPTNWPPLGVENLLTDPSPVLATDRGPTSPLDWLVDGGDPDSVVALVRRLDVRA